MKCRAYKLGASFHKKRRLSKLAVALLAGLCAYIPACNPDGTSEKKKSITTTVTPAPPPPREVLFFPSEMRVDDESLNQFVVEAMQTCVTGEYDAFRLIWSAREEPMARGEFDKGWKAIEEIRVLALEKVRLAPDKDQISQTPELVYALYANVKLNADLISPQQKPERDAISMIVREQGKWRMAKAPKKMRHWLKTLVAPTEETDKPPAGPAIKTTPISKPITSPK